MDLRLLTVCLLGLTVASAFQIKYDGDKVIRLLPKTYADYEWLAGLHETPFKVKVWGEREGGLDVHVPSDSAHSFINTLHRVGMRYTVLIEDLQDEIDREVEFRVPIADLRDYDFTTYLTLDEINAYLDEMVVLCGSRCSMESIGSSWEARDLRVFKISTGGSGKRAIWVDSGIHAREWIAFSTGLYFIDRFVKDFDTDTDIQDILNSYDVYIQPTVNPDGYVYTWTDDRMWRRTRSYRPADSMICYGADANRNFDFHWMEVGASDRPCDDTYAGPSPNSEPESKAINDYIMDPSRLGSWDVYMTLHTYGQLWMAPYGYTTTPPSNYDELMRVGSAGVSALEAVYGTQYTLGSASEILYSSSGTSRDWAAGVPLIPYVFTLELRDTSSFVLPPNQILPTGVETWAGFKGMMFAIMNP